MKSRDSKGRFIKGHPKMGGYSIPKGNVPSIETRQKISNTSKGRIVSQETRKRISSTLKGRPLNEERKRKIRNAWKNKPLDEEQRKKISERFTGRKLPEKTKEKIRNSLRGKPRPWQKGRKLSQETRKKISDKLKGKIVSSETKKKISEALKGHPYHLVIYSEKSRELMSYKRKIFLKEHPRKMTEQEKRKLSKRMIGNQIMVGRKLSKETKTKIGKASRQNWENPNYVKKRFQTIRKNFSHKLPNKQEVLLQSFLDKIVPGRYKFVGNYQFRIERFYPDFVNINGQKKIIELFGDYWHKNEDPQQRIKIFAGYGFQTLVIWEKELKDLDNLEKRIRGFEYDK